MPPAPYLRQLNQSVRGRGTQALVASKVPPGDPNISLGNRAPLMYEGGASSLPGMLFPTLTGQKTEKWLSEATKLDVCTTLALTLQRSNSLSWELVRSES